MNQQLDKIPYPLECFMCRNLFPETEAVEYRNVIICEDCDSAIHFNLERHND